MKNEESRGEKRDREKIGQSQRTKRIIGKEVKEGREEWRERIL